MQGNKMQQNSNVKGSQSSKCKRTRQGYYSMETMDLGSWVHSILSLSNNGGDRVMDDKVHTIVML